jgi:hypothetical protein
MMDAASDEAAMLAAGHGEPTQDSGEAEKTNPKIGRKKLFLFWFMAVLMSAGISASSILVYDRHFATRIVAVDIKGFIAAQRDLYVQGKIDDAQLRQNIETLDRRIQEIPANVVVIMGDVVVRNAKIIKP